MKTIRWFFNGDLNLLILTLLISACSSEKTSITGKPEALTSGSKLLSAMSNEGLENLEIRELSAGNTNIQSHEDFSSSNSFSAKLFFEPQEDSQKQDTVIFLSNGNMSQLSDGAAGLRCKNGQFDVFDNTAYRPTNLSCIKNKIYLVEFALDPAKPQKYNIKIKESTPGSPSIVIAIDNLSFRNKAHQSLNRVNIVSTSGSSDRYTQAHFQAKNASSNPGTGASSSSSSSTSTAPKGCGTMADGQSETRTTLRYVSREPAAGQPCKSATLTQTRTCNNGTLSEFLPASINGYPAESCTPQTGIISGTAMRRSVSQYGITWTFDKDYPVGQFVTGDYFVVGPITLVDITPKSTRVDYTVCVANCFNRNPDGSKKTSDDVLENKIGHIHGTMINPTVTRTGPVQGFDYRLNSTGYDQNLNIARPGNLPKQIPINSSILSSISHPDDKRNKPGDLPQLEVIAILTVLGTVPPEKSFRPPYQGTKKEILGTEAHLNYGVLAKLPKVANTPNLSEVTNYFQKPYIEIETGWTGRYFHPSSNYPTISYWGPSKVDAAFGREMAHTLAFGLLSLHLDYTNQEKRTLFIRMVQVGIDIYGAASNGGYWGDGGGHNIGRKMPLIFAGKALGNQKILEYGNKAKHFIFSDDHQTFEVTEKEVKQKLQECSSCKTKGVKLVPYTSNDIGTFDWGINHKDQPHFDNANFDIPHTKSSGKGSLYRDVAGSPMVGHILTAHIMGVRQLWNHEPAFRYYEHYANNWDVGSSVNLIQPFVSQMWKAYRNRY